MYVNKSYRSIMISCHSPITCISGPGFSETHFIYYVPVSHSNESEHSFPTIFSPFTDISYIKSKYTEHHLSTLPFVYNQPNWAQHFSSCVPCQSVLIQVVSELPYDTCNISSRNRKAICQRKKASLAAFMIAFCLRYFITYGIRRQHMSLATTIQTHR